MRRKSQISNVTAWIVAFVMTLGLATPFAHFTVVAQESETVCPVRVGTRVWAPDLIDAHSIGSGRHYMLNPAGESLGLTLSSGDANPYALSTIEDGVIRFEAGGDYRRLQVTVEGTGTGVEVDGETITPAQLGFPAVEGATYRITLIAENEFRSGPANIQFRQFDGQTTSAAPVSGSRFEYTFTYHYADRNVNPGADNPGAHGTVALGIVIVGSGGTIVHISDIAIYQIDPDGICNCDYGVLAWSVFPADAHVSFTGTPGNSETGHIMRLSNIEFDDENLPTRGANLEFTLRGAMNSGRRILAWTDLSGNAEEITDFTFATTDNIVDEKVMVSGVFGTGATAGETMINIALPQHLLYNNGVFATEIYVLFGINKGDIGDMAADDNYNMLPGNRGGTTRNDVHGIDLAKEFDIIDNVALNVFEPIVFNTNISLNPGATESEIGFTWWTPRGEASDAVLQLVPVSTLVGGEMPANARTIQGTGPAPIHSTSVLPGYQYDYNRVMVTGLTLGTTYAYRVGDGNPEHWSPVFTFRTFDPDNGFNVILFGDPQLNPTPDRLLTIWRNTINMSVARADAMGGASFVLSTGDQTGGGANDPFAITNYLDPVQLRGLPVMATVGNHDTQSQRTGAHLESGFSIFSRVYNWPNHDWLGGNPYDSNDFKRGGGNWFFSYGDVLFISFNANLSNPEHIETYHRPFMERAVASHPDATWRIVTFHQDIFGNGTGHAMGMGPRRAAWTPLLNDFDIDVVLNGHDHTHTRTHFMQGMDIYRNQMPTVHDADQMAIFNTPTGTYISPTGIMYLTLGAAADVPKYTSIVPWLPWVAYSDPAEHDPFPQYSIMRIEGDTLTIETWIIEGMTERKHDGITIRKTANQGDLQSIVEGMAVVAQNDISAVTWDAFQAAIANARTAAADPTANHHAAFIALYEAYYAIDPATDKLALGNLYREARAVWDVAIEGPWAGQYPFGSKAVLEAVLVEAFMVYDLRLSNQTQINAALASLQAAYSHFLSVVSDVPTPWIFVHDIPASGTYTMSLIDWMLEDEPTYFEPNHDGKPTLFAHFTKAPYSHNMDNAVRSDVRFSPATQPGGRGLQEGHITRTRIGEWIRYELNVEQAGAYRATLGAVNPTNYEQIVVLRDMNQRILTMFHIPANNPLPATGWQDALLVEADNEFFLPSGNVILEVFFVNCGVGATANADTDPNVYRDGPNVDILTLERVGEMEAPVHIFDQNLWPLPHAVTRIGGDASHRQRMWTTDGHECPMSGWVGHGLPVHIYNRVIGIVMEVAGRPGGPEGNHMTQIHIENDGGGTWLPEYNPPVGVVWNPDIGPFGALVWDLVNMPMLDGSSHAGIVHFPTIAATQEWGRINVAYYTNGWEQLNYMRAYLILSECTVCGSECIYDIPEWWWFHGYEVE